MYRRSDISDSTTQADTPITGQRGKLPREDIISDNSKNSLSRTNSFNTRQFSNESIRRESHRGQMNDRSMTSTHTSSIPRVSDTTVRSKTTEMPVRSSGRGSSSSSRSERTGAAPYLYGQHEARKASAKKTKDPLYIRVLRWAYYNRRAAAAVLGLFLVITVAIPLVIFAASGDAVPSLFRDLNSTTETGGSDTTDGVNAHFPTVDKGSDNSTPESPKNELPAGTPDTTDDNTKDITESEKDVPTEEPSSSDNITEDSMTSAPSTTAPVETQPPQSEAETEEIESDPIPPNAFPVTISFYDREAIFCYTEPATLRQILINQGYYLRDTDRPSVSLDDMIEGETWIMIDTVVTKTVTVSEAIPFETVLYESDTVPRGTTKTVSAGVNGTKDKVYNVEYVNGVEVSRTFAYEYIATNPQNQVDYYGVGGTFTAPDGTTYSYSYKLNVRATYYNIHGNTATGLPTGDNVMAVDPSVIPLWSNVYVMNDYYDMGVRIAADTGGAVKGNIIDLWMSDGSPYYIEFAHQGVHNMVAYILD